MKFIHILIALPVVLLTACSNTNPDKNGNQLITGKLNNAEGVVLYLERMEPSGLKPVDTYTVNAGGEFTLVGDVKEPGYYRLRITDKNFITLVLDVKQKVEITGDATNLDASYTVKGSPDSEKFQLMSRTSTKNYRQRDSIQKVFNDFVAIYSDDQAKIDSMNKVLEVPFLQLIKENNQFLADFVSKNKTSIVSLAAIQQLSIDDYMQTYIDLDKALFAKYPNIEYVKGFHRDVKTKTACAIGTEAPEIKYNTPDGKPLALSSLKGKVVLIDFWASWCGPCRAENPNVVAAYNKFKAKGFDIYSVSLDNNMDRWKAAIQKDNLTWKSHVCDFKGWQSPVVQEYNFNGIPYNVLIDKDGKIIAKNLRGEALERQLEAVFK